MTSRNRRKHKSANRDGVGEIKRTHFGEYFQANRIVVLNGSCKFQLHAEGLELHRDRGLPGCARNYGVRQFSTSQKARRLAVRCEQIRLGQDLQHISLLQVLNGRAQVKDRKSTRLNSSYVAISYAVFCLKKKKKFTLSVH